MNTKRLSYIPALFLVGLFAASGVSAHEGLTVEIKNNSGEKRKICAYKGISNIDLTAQRCFTMSPDESVLWNRQGDRSNFKVKIFESNTLVDKYLYTRELPGDTQTILIGEGGKFGSTRQERKPAAIKYWLKVCNYQFDETVYFTIGLETNDVFMTRGWWDVAKDACVDLDISEMLKRDWKVPYGNLPKTYYYARTYGNSPLFWVGGETDQSLCINEKKAFSLSQFLKGGSGTREANPCNGTGEMKVKFRKMNDPIASEEFYYLTF